MSSPDNKENVSPRLHSELFDESAQFPRKSSRKGRSKSIGPGGLSEPGNDLSNAKTAQSISKNRRKSTYVPATKAIISADNEKAERQAARRKTLANRRVSFAPEATLHTWDVIEFMRDPTISTESPGSTRRGSNINGTSNDKLSPNKAQSPPSPGAPELSDLWSPMKPQESKQKKSRRSSGIPPMNFNNPDEFSSSGMSGSSDMSVSDDDDANDFEDGDDDTGTAMSVDTDSNTMLSHAESSSSTDSSARLEAALKSAAETAGTRGIEYDEFGEEVSMELAAEEVTNALKPWEEQRGMNQTYDSAAADQENVNPFSAGYHAHLVSGTISMPSRIEEEETGDFSMEMTRAVGNIVTALPSRAESPLAEDSSMDLTQAVGKIQNGSMGNHSGRNGQKRRRSTTEAGSPGVNVMTSQSKRRRSSVARSSNGDESMDLTMAIGRITNDASPSTSQRRRSVARRRSSGIMSDQSEATVDITRAVGGVWRTAAVEPTEDNEDDNEELTMEMATIVGRIKGQDRTPAGSPRPKTPQTPQSPLQAAANTTPKDQMRFMTPPEEGPRLLLTPVFQKQATPALQQPKSASKSPAKLSSPVQQSPAANLRKRFSKRQSSPLRAQESPLRIASAFSPKQQVPSSPMKASPKQAPQDSSPARAQISPRTTRSVATAPGTVTHPTLDANGSQASPSSLQRGIQSPAQPILPPDEVAEEPTLRLTESIKMMSTPRKDALRSLSIKQQSVAPPSFTPKRKHKSPNPETPRSPQQAPAAEEIPNSLPAADIEDDLLQAKSTNDLNQKVRLQDFLDLAGIRFIDLVTTKRRLTTAPTPSKSRKGVQDVESRQVTLEDAVIAGGCTGPEVEMYEHACHELRRYISDGKRVIQELETQTALDNPPLIRAYTNGTLQKQTTIDAQMRDMKTNARLQSKGMWYAWRSQLLKDLMNGLQSIGEGLINDDSILQHSELLINQHLPELLDKRDKLLLDLRVLEEEAAAINEDELEELEPARDRLQQTSQEIREKQEMLRHLQEEAQEQDTILADLEDNRAEFNAAIREAEGVRDACRGISIQQMDTLKKSIEGIEQATGWTIASASSSPPTVSMRYRSQLELSFQPGSFQESTRLEEYVRPNTSISLSYLAAQPPSTTLRFFLQLLRASLHSVTQCRTRVFQLLKFVGNTWNFAQELEVAERLLNLETLTESRILSDEQICLVSTILLPERRTKVALTFQIIASLGGSDGENLRLATSMHGRAGVVYGDKEAERYLAEAIARTTEKEPCEWAAAVREIRERLRSRASHGQGACYRDFQSLPST